MTLFKNNNIVYFIMNMKYQITEKNFYRVCLLYSNIV